MDKIAANNHFVTMRKEIKKAKAMVCGNLVRKINKCKQERDRTQDEDKHKKLDRRISNLHDEIKLLKTLDAYTIAKAATLKHEPEYWAKLVSHPKASIQERLTGRVVTKNNVQKQIHTFRSGHIDCDEWLEQYIEFREKKKELKKPKRVGSGAGKRTSYHV